MRKFLAIVLVLALSLALSGCWVFSGGSSARIGKKSFSLNQDKRLGQLTYKVSDELTESVSEDYDRSNMRRGFRYDYSVDGTVVFSVRIREYSINLSWAPMTEDLEKFDNDENTEFLRDGSDKFNGTKWAYVCYDLKESEFGPNAEYDLYFGTYDRLGVRYYYKIEFMNCTEDTEGFIKAFMKGTKITK